MSTTSLYLQMVLQALDENPDTWGSVLNVSAIQLLEDGIAGTGEVAVTAGDQTLTDTVGGPSDLGPGTTPAARLQILNITGAPGVARAVNVPARSKTYLCANNTTGGFDITVKTTAGAGVIITSGEAQWVYCDGTDVIETTATNSANATLAATATNALSLGGVLAAEYAQLAVAQTWTAGQVVQRITLVDAAGDITPNCALSNAFFHLMLQGENLATPLNPTNGQQFSVIIEQGVGAPWALTYQSNTFIWEGGVVPVLSTIFGDIDYLAFEYVTDAAVGNRWVGSILKGVA